MSDWADEMAAEWSTLSDEGRAELVRDLRAAYERGVRDAAEVCERQGSGESPPAPWKLEMAQRILALLTTKGPTDGPRQELVDDWTRYCTSLSDKKAPTE